MYQWWYLTLEFFLPKISTIEILCKFCYCGVLLFSFQAQFQYSAHTHTHTVFLWFLLAGWLAIIQSYKYCFYTFIVICVCISIKLYIYIYIKQFFLYNNLRKLWLACLDFRLKVQTWVPNRVTHLWLAKQWLCSTSARRWGEMFRFAQGLLGGKVGEALKQSSAELSSKNKSETTKNRIISIKVRGVNHPKFGLFLSALHFMFCLLIWRMAPLRTIQCRELKRCQILHSASFIW